MSCDYQIIRARLYAFGTCRQGKAQTQLLYFYSQSCFSMKAEDTLAKFIQPCLAKEFMGGVDIPRSYLWATYR